MKMFKTVCATLVALVMPFPLSAAGPRRTAPPPTPPPGLTAVEQKCHGYGVYAMNRAYDRDHGFSLLEVLSRSRQYDQSQGTDAAIQRMHDFLARAVYESPTVPPLQIRQLTELACLGKAAPVQASQPQTDPNLRY